jgi:EAL domain-containing protein (putative c-di-GMP-specific phosphodiesterase class I)/DNA-binding response OmpR family regulator
MNSADAIIAIETSDALTRIIVKRVELMGKRLRRFLNEGWDINGLALLYDDVQELLPACHSSQLTSLSENLEKIGRLLSNTLHEQVLPEPATGERLKHHIEMLQNDLPSFNEPAPTKHSVSPVKGALSARAETPPPAYWRRWGGDAPPMQQVELGELSVPQAAVVNIDIIDPWSRATPHFGKLDTKSVANATSSSVSEIDAMIESSLINAVPSEPVVHVELEKIDAVEILSQHMSEEEPTSDISHLPVPKGFRVYHLTAYSPISSALDQRFELQGMELELLENESELKELLGTFPADLILIDAEFSEHIETIGKEVRAIRQRNHRKLTLVALSNADDMNMRLSARRAGVDVLIVDAKSVEDVLQRLREQLDPNREAAYRVMIVEDDRSQAMFAESILRNNGMETMIVLDSMDVLPAMEQFQPDLLLMDLNMPGANGIELTSLIREQDSHLHTPIVFLSGEHDEDRQFDAIDAGGDDFLSKPIRPRHLLSAVQNRIRRHRAVSQRQHKRNGKDPVTGMFERQELMTMINSSVSSTAMNKTGGVLLLEIESLASLRERLGISVFEQLQIDVIKLLAQHSDGLPSARFGDGNYMIYSASMTEAELEIIAARCRTDIIEHAFDTPEGALKLRMSVGVCSFRHPFIDGIHVLNSVEKACHEARTGDRGIQCYVPPNASELERESGLLKQLRQSIEHESLELLYQPVVAVGGGEETQYQTLLRMRDTQGKLLSAAEIIPIAEHGNFITDIDRWVLLRAINLIRGRSEEQKSIRLFISQSVLTLINPTHIEWLKKEINDQGITGSNIVIEIRMEEISAHIAEIKRFCNSLTADGVQFCLSQCEINAETDRFIEELPLGFVKLSRKYSAANQVHSVRDELKTLINQAHRRGLEVIGTGVEDPQSAATLWMSGIDYIQGNLVQQADHHLHFDFQQAVL